jgi:hypothetical protein
MKILDWLEETMFRYFSYATKDSEYRGVRWVVFISFLIPVVLGVCFMGMGLMDLMRLCAGIFMWMFISFCLLWIIVWIYHNQKMKKLDNRWK